MPICLECGKNMPRLQWTHFKYKCTGKFNNGTDYIKVYPHAKLVDDDIAKKTAITLENLTNKYGEDEAVVRWNSYKEKQAYTNSFEYKKETHGWTRDQYDEYNKSRAVTLENLIKKHGIDIATTVYQDYVNAQAYTCSEEYFIKEYGEDEGLRKYSNFCKVRSTSNWVNRSDRSSPQASRLEDDVFIKIQSEIYSNLENQIVIRNAGKGCGAFDFGCHEKKKLIEFYGTYWHGDIRVYDKNYIHPTMKKPLYEIHEKDARKRLKAISLGYDVYVIWEKDWMENPNKVINDVKRWWNDN